MDLADTLLFPHERTMLVGPLEDGTLEVANISEPGGAQPIRGFARAITDRAIRHDRRVLRQSRGDAFGRATRVDPTCARQMAHVPFFRRPHIEKDGRGPALV